MNEGKNADAAMIFLPSPEKCQLILLISELTVIVFSKKKIMDYEGERDTRNLLYACCVYEACDLNRALIIVYKYLNDIIRISIMVT